MPTPNDSSKSTLLWHRHTAFQPSTHSQPATYRYRQLAALLLLVLSAVQVNSLCMRLKVVMSTPMESLAKEGQRSHKAQGKGVGCRHGLGESDGLTTLQVFLQGMLKKCTTRPTLSEATAHT